MYWDNTNENVVYIRLRKQRACLLNVLCIGVVLVSKCRNVGAGENCFRGAVQSNTRKARKTKNSVSLRLSNVRSLLNNGWSVPLRIYRIHCGDERSCLAFHRWALWCTKCRRNVHSIVQQSTFWPMFSVKPEQISPGFDSPSGDISFKSPNEKNTPFTA